MNRQLPNFKFTKEVEQDQSLPFLDIQIKRNEDGTLNISVITNYLFRSKLRDGPFDIQGGWDFFEKIVCFPLGAKKIKCLQRS